MQSTLKDGRVLRIRHARVEDAAALVDYLERVSAESDNLSFGAGELATTVEEEARYIRELEGGRAGFALLGEVDGAIAAVCTISRSARPRLGHIGVLGITVAKAHHGRGLGKAMCLRMLHVAREVGCTKIELRVREDNAIAIALYDRLGFVREGLTLRGLRIGDGYFNDVLMGVCL